MAELIRPRRWLMVALAFLATVVNYLDRQTLSVAAPVLRKELGFGDIEYSRIVSAFLLAYTISNGLSGPLIDRVGTRTGYALCMLWWSAASVLHGFARSAVSLGACRFLLGIGEAGNWPAAIRLVSEWFPVRERALASGIFNSGSAIGAVIAAPLVAWLILHFGWPSSFFTIGAVGFVWLIFWWLTYYTPPQISSEANLPPPPALTLLRQKFVWSLLIAKIFFDSTWYFYVFWFPQYLSSARHFDLAQIGMYAWIPFLTADIGNFAGGGLSALLIRRRWSVLATRKACFALFTGLMTSAVPAVLVDDPRISIFFVCIATFGYTGCQANVLSLPADFYPRNSLASIWGLASMGSGFGGMVFSLLTGWVVDRFGYVPVFFGFGAAPLIAGAILVLVTASRRDPQPHGT